MNSRTKEIYIQAHELEEEGREAFLVEACGEDTELRREVQDLLDRANRVEAVLGAFDEDLATGGDEDGNGIGVLVPREDLRPISESEGDIIGPYTLREKLGEGGFGIVWKAEQSEPIARFVALKVVKAGMDSEEVLARFETERQALAVLDHPHIAKVHDAGVTSNGRPYFAMELVQGIPITQVCTERNLDTEARLQLFRAVCSAVNHAHQKGIIHRDLKPSNILVCANENELLPKVIDFGIAKATEQDLTDGTAVTRMQQLLGTPAYMSPEQAGMGAMDIDTRSDIYSLGVLLYELLAGKPPFDSKTLISAGYDEMRRVIREEEPPKPSTRLTESRSASHTNEHITPGVLRGELDWIVMKALEKDRAYRYETANAFAADVGRYLAGEAVQAVAPSAVYRIRKFAQRNKTALGMVAGLALFLIAASIVSAWFGVRAVEAEKLAKERLEESEAAREKETAARLEAEEVAKFLGAVFRSPDPRRDGRTITVAEVLDRASQNLESDLGNPLRQTILREAVANSYGHLGLHTEEVSLLEKMLEFGRSEYGDEYGSTLNTMNSLAIAYKNVGRYDEALQLGKEVFEIGRKVHGMKSRGTLGTMSNLADYYGLVGHREKQIELHEEVLPLMRGELPRDDPYTRVAMGNLANAYKDAGRTTEALELLEEVMEIEGRELDPERPETLTTMHHLANLYDSTGRQGEAETLYLRMLPFSEKIHGPENPDTIDLNYNLANLYLTTGRLEQAFDFHRKAFQLNLKVRPRHERTLWSAHNLAVTVSKGDFEPEEEVAALADAGRHFPREPVIQLELGYAYFDAGMHDEAVKALRVARKHYHKGGHGLKASVQLVHSLKMLGREHEAFVEQARWVARSSPLDQSAPAVITTIVPVDSKWRWLHPTNGIDPAKSDIDFHTTFYTEEFDDAGWTTGHDSEGPNGGFGYGGGEEFLGVDIGTPGVDPKTGKPVNRYSAYFRCKFRTNQAHRNLELRLQRDDGVIVYVNGEEVGRDNMNIGKEAYKLAATHPVGGDQEVTLRRVPLPGVVLRKGENILAISLHNTENPSTDLRIGEISLVEVNEQQAMEEVKRKWRSRG